MKHRLSLALSLVLLLSLAIPSLALADGGNSGQPGHPGRIDRSLPAGGGTGFATGGGWFLWPGSQDKTNFAFTVKINPKSNKVQGNLLVIRHLADGHIARLKSTSLANLVIQEAGTCRAASFDGTGTYRSWDAGLKKYVSSQAVAFSAYVKDCGEPGKGIDSFWVSGSGDLVMTAPAASHLVLIGGGNIAIHAAAGNNRGQEKDNKPKNDQGSEIEQFIWRPALSDKTIPPPRD